jgi:hypothetical protein
MAECPLLAQSGHSIRTGESPLFDGKRTLNTPVWTSDPITKLLMMQVNVQQLAVEAAVHGSKEIAFA